MAHLVLFDIAAVVVAFWHAVQHVARVDVHVAGLETHIVGFDARVADHDADVAGLVVHDADVAALVALVVVVRVDYVDELAVDWTQLVAHAGGVKHVAGHAS